MTEVPAEPNGSSPLGAGLFRQLVDLALAEDLLSLGAVGLSAAVDEIDLADLPERIGEVSASWIAGAIADVAEEDRLEAINRFTADLMAAINRSTAEQ